MITFFINKDEELSVELLRKMLNKFCMDELPTLLKYKNYYEGKHAILQKKYKDESKVCNHVVTNFCRIITDTYSGYIAGKSISYVSNDDIEDIQSVINYNDDDSENMQWLTNALIYGVGYELQWLDKQSQIRYSQINPLNGFPVYSNTLDSELVAFVRWYDIDTFDERDLKKYSRWLEEQKNQPVKKQEIKPQQPQQPEENNEENNQEQEIQE